MRKRDSSGSGSGDRRKSSGRSGARSNSSRGSRPTSSRGEKPFGRSRDDDSKPRRTSRFSSDRDDSKKDFSNPRGGKSFGRKEDSGFSSRSEKPYGRPRKDDDSKPSRSRFSSDRDDSKSFSKSTRGGKSFGRKEDSGFSSRSEKPYSRPRRDDEESGRKSRFSGDRDDTKKSYSSRGEKSYSRPRREEDESGKPSRFNKSSRFSEKRDDVKRDFSKPPRGKSFDRSFDESSKPEGDKRSFDRSEKKGFFSKLSRGGKSFEKRHDKDFGKSVKDFSETKQDQQDASSSKIRLNKYISNSGVCSRREADELITMGLVTVNGTVITELGYKINPKDVVKYDGKTLRSEKPVYILMNKPKGFLTTTKDPQERNTVMQIIAGHVKERVYPVGRLDRNTTGLLLLTNDGELTERLSHPSHNVKKIYKVELDKPLTKADFQKIMDGIVLEEGRAMVDDLAIVSEDGKTVGIELHIGWNRVVRRIFERLDYTVVKLDRTIYAGLDKKDLARGHWRFLTNEEVVRLKHYNK